jgi:hypothetical protein
MNRYKERLQILINSQQHSWLFSKKKYAFQIKS